MTTTTEIASAYRINPAFLSDTRRRNQITSTLKTAGYTYDSASRTWTRKSELDKYESHGRNESSVAFAASRNEIIPV